MICPSCGHKTARLIIDRAGKACAKCRGLSESAGARTTGTLTRNSDRIRQQQLRHEGDIIPPHIFDKTTKKFMPNPDFLKRYPEQITANYSAEELKSAGHSKIDKVFKQAKQEKIAHEREQNSGITYRNDPKPGQSGTGVPGLHLET